MHLYLVKLLMLIFITIMQMYCGSPTKPGGNTDLTNDSTIIPIDSTEDSNDELSKFESVDLPFGGGFGYFPYFDSYSGNGYVNVHWNTDYNGGFGGDDANVLQVSKIDLLISSEGPSKGFRRIQQTEKTDEDSLQVDSLINDKLYYFRLITYDERDSIVNVSKPLMTSPGAELIEFAQIQADQADPPEYLDVMDWLSDGTQIVYIRSIGGSESNIYIYDLLSNESRQITDFSGSHRLMGVDCQPSGSGILYNYSPSRTAGSINYRVWHLPEPYDQSAAIPLTAGRVDGDGFWLTDSQIIYTKGSYEPPNIPVIRILRVGAEIVGTTLINMGGLYQYDPSVSDDGTMIAFTGRSDLSGIYTAHLPEASDVALTLKDEYSWAHILPRWIPAELALLFSSNRSGHFELWQLDLLTLTFRQVTRSARGWEVIGGAIDPTSKYLVSHTISGPREGMLIVSERP